MIGIRKRLFAQAGGALAFVLGLLSCYCEPKRPPLDKRFPEPTVTSQEAKPVSQTQAETHSPASIIADVPTTPTAVLAGPAVPLTLADVLHTTLANNLDVRIEELNRQNARDEIMAARGIYDLNTRANANVERTEFSRSSSSDIGGRTRSKGHTTTSFFGAGASQLVPSGGVFSVDYTNLDTRTRSRTRSDFGSSTDVSQNDPQEVVLGVTQPLLKDFGPTVTNASIRIAKNDSKISYEAFRLELMQQLADALRTYWDLVFAMNNFDVRKVSMAQAQELLRTNQVKYETGWSPITDVLQAQAQVASRAEQVLTAQRQIQDIMDRLKNLMNIPRNVEQWRLQFIPLQKPTFFETAYNETESLRLALLKRPEALQADLFYQNRLIIKDVQRNQLLPTLDLTGNIGLLDTDEDVDGEEENYSAGLIFQYPLQNRTARARYRQAATNVTAGQLSVEQTEQAILQEVRTFYRAIQTARQQIDVTSAAIQYETQKLQSERDRFEVGISTSFQVLEFQEDYAQAQVNYLLAVIQYNKALIDFEVARGTLLDTLGVQVRDYGVSKPTVKDYYGDVNTAADKKAALGK